MLEFLRNGVRTWYFKALLGVLVLSFAIWGVGDIFRPGLVGNTLIKVGSIEIGAQEFASAFRRQMNSLTRTLGSEFSVDQARRLGVPDRVVNGLVVDALYNSEAGALGIGVADNAVAKRIRTEPSFRNQQGQFDRGVFEQTLAVNGFSEQQFVLRLRQELSRTQVVGSLTRDVPAFSQLADRLYRWREEKRVAKYIAIQNDAFADVGTPDDAALKAYHKANERTFTAPEYRNATYIHLTSADAEGEIAVPDSDIQALYDQRLDSYKVPERRTVQQMIFPTEQAAKTAVGQLSEGKEFVALAKTLLNQDESATNVLGDVPKGSLPDALADAVFSLSIDQVSAALKGPFGWYVLRVTGTKPPYTQPLEEVRKSLRAELVAERSDDVLYELSKDLDDALGGGATLKEAASRIGVSAKNVVMVDRRGNGTDGKPIAGLPKGRDFLATVFDTPSGEESDLIDLGASGYLVVRAGDVIPSQVRPLHTVRARVVQAWQAEQRRKLTKKKANKALDRIKGGENLSVVAGELGATVETSPAFNREGEGAEKNLPRAVAADLFEARIGGTASAPFGAGYTVAVLNEIKPVNVGANRSAINALGDRLAQRIASDLEVQYNNALRQHHTVEIDRQALDSLLLRF